MQNYTPDDYDKHSCLKPGLWLYIAVFFAMKDVVLIIVEALSGLKAKGGANNLSYFEQLVQPEMVLVNILGLFVFVSLIKRDPDVTGFWKNVFFKGRKILIAAFVLHLVILAYEQYLLAAETYKWSKGISLPLIYMMVVDMIFLAAIITSERVKIVFSEWPEAKKVS